MLSKYKVGQVIRIRISFTEVSSGNLVDPTTITAYYQKPSKETTVLVYETDDELVRESLGIFYTDISLTEGGRWNYRFKGEGDVFAANQNYFDVDSLVIDE